MRRGLPAAHARGPSRLAGTHIGIRARRHAGAGGHPGIEALLDRGGGAPSATAPAAPNPAAARPVPATAPAPSCGPPAIRPLAMPGPKIDRPSKDRAARIKVSALLIVGGLFSPPVNCPKIVEPMPMMTASTRILTPEETTLPSTFSARNAVRPKRPNGTSTKPARVVSLNSRRLTKAGSRSRRS
jgi:hypothetical protein